MRDFLIPDLWALISSIAVWRFFRESGTISTSTVPSLTEGIGMRIGWLRKLFGNQGERVAARYLRQQGYRILARQTRTPQGEIDLIALDGDVVVFVEVKTRSSHAAGHPSEAVDTRKQQQLTRTALSWLKRKRLLSYRGRFDVVAITWQNGTDPCVQHYKHAFSASGVSGMYS